jgi:hypothetical protein
LKRLTKAIIVLILVIAILGVGFVIMRKVFGGVGTNPDDDIMYYPKSDIIQKINESGEPLAFNHVDINVSRGKRTAFYFGVKNIGAAEQTFSFEWTCKSAIVDCDSFNSTWFKTFSIINLKPGDVGILPATVLADAPGRYNLTLTVRTVGGTGGVYASGDLFLTVR